MKRLTLLALVAVALAPGTWLRSPPATDDLRPILRFERLEADLSHSGEIAIEGIWELTSPNIHFNSYSALVALSSHRLLAVSDRGRWMEFPIPGFAGAPRFGVIGGTVEPDKRQVDVEAASYDAASKRIWLASEGANSIDRSGLDFGDTERVRPDSMRRWPGNRGPEAMTRLADGRFVILGEGSPEWTGVGYPGVLFDGDPVEGAEAMTFDFVPPEDYRSTDMALLPDGRVLILLRKIVNVLPPRFSTRLMVADPGAISANRPWRGRTIAMLGTDLPNDNFEGLAVVPRDDGSLTLWLISDDNGAALQQTLLYRLRWTPENRQLDMRKARGSTTRL